MRGLRLRLQFDRLTGLVHLGSDVERPGDSRECGEEHKVDVVLTDAVAATESETVLAVDSGEFG